MGYVTWTVWKESQEVVDLNVVSYCSVCQPQWKHLTNESRISFGLFYGQKTAVGTRTDLGVAC